MGKMFSDDVQTTCPTCLALFLMPKTLPCLHTFCKNCLDRVVKKSADKTKVECPTCRTQHDLPPKGVEGFSTNYTASGIVEILNLGTESCPPAQTALVCENEIDDNPAASKCIDCDYYLCESCTNLHKKQRLSKHHKVLLLAEIKEGGVKQLEQKRYCSAHEGEELKLYCRTCEEAICRDCAIVTHKQHDYTFIKDVREELTKKMESLMASVGRKEAEYRGLLDSIHQASEKEHEKLDTDKSKISELFDEHIKRLKHCKKCLLDTVSQFSTLHHMNLSTNEQGVVFYRNQLASALTFAQQLISSASNTDLAMMSKQVIKQLETLRKQHHEAVKPSMWVLHLSEENLLSSHVKYDALVKAVVVSELANHALMGKNTFQISAKDIPASAKLEPAVTATLSSGESCPVKIKLSRKESWSASCSYYILRCPDKASASTSVKLDITISGLQIKSSQLKYKNSLAVGTTVKVTRPFVRLGTVYSEGDPEAVGSDGKQEGYMYHTVVKWDNGTISCVQLHFFRILLE